jgi:hypothetical protein
MNSIIIAADILALIVAIYAVMLGSNAPNPYTETDTWRDHEIERQ